VRSAWRKSGTRKSGAEVLTLKGHTSSVVSASFSPDGSRIVTCECGQHDEGLGREEWCRGPHAQSRHQWRRVGVVQPGRFADRDRECGQHGEGLGREEWCRGPHAQGHTDLVMSASFSPDGSRIVTASADNTAKVWDAKSGAEVLTLKGHTQYVVSASFSPDGSRIVTASADRTAKVWDAKSGVPVLTLKGHAGDVKSASFSPDGSRIVTASADNTAKVWDAKSGAEVLMPQGAH